MKKTVSTIFFVLVFATTLFAQNRGPQNLHTQPSYVQPVQPTYAPDGRRIIRPVPPARHLSDGAIRTPFMLGFVNPLQVPGADADVVGLRLNILYGSCRDLSGLDIGLFNEIKDYGSALQIGVVNYAGELQGWQIGAINNARLLKGFQLGAINYCDGAEGVQIGFVNVISDKDFPFLPLINMSF